MMVWPVAQALRMAAPWQCVELHLAVLDMDVKKVLRNMLRAEAPSAVRFYRKDVILAMAEDLGHGVERQPTVRHHVHLEGCGGACGAVWKTSELSDGKQGRSIPTDIIR